MPPNRTAQWEVGFYVRHKGYHGFLGCAREEDAIDRARQVAFHRELWKHPLSIPRRHHKLWRSGAVKNMQTGLVRWFDSQGHEVET
jgi:hypothetical protein